MHEDIILKNVQAGRRAGTLDRCNDPAPVFNGKRTDSRARGGQRARFSQRRGGKVSLAEVSIQTALVPADDAPDSTEETS